jgi:peroxiredoxin
MIEGAIAMYRSTFTAILSATLSLLLIACNGTPGPEASVAAKTDAAPIAKTTAAWPQSDKAVSPLLLGNALPEVTLRTLEDAPITLKEAVGGKPAALVFYRGGWCPYCNLQLSGLRLIRKDLDAMGFQLIAISPDNPAELKKTLDKDALDYRLLSDSSAEAMRAFGIGYEVDAEMLKKLTGYGIDLEKASGQTHHVLPVPSVYLVDARGTLQFSYVHPDYTVRLPQEVVLAAARAIDSQKHQLKLN